MGAPELEIVQLVNGVPVLPNVRGGSGRRYYTIADALAGETAQFLLDGGHSALGGTSSGVVVGPAALNATDDFYNNFWLVDQNGTPAFGLVRRFARVSDYVGASRTFTLDQPINFTGEVFFVVRPIQLSLEGDITENITLSNGGVELNLSGHKIIGKIDITGSGFYWIRNGWVTNGIQSSADCSVMLSDIKTSRRDNTIYAVLIMASTACIILERCTFSGRVAGRSPRSSWQISGCRNYGCIDANGNNIPYALVESIPGTAIALVQLDASINGEFSGAFIYSENSITGSPDISTQGSWFMPTEDVFNIPIRTNRGFAYFWCGAGGSMTLTPTSTSVYGGSAEYYGSRLVTEANSTPIGVHVAVLQLFNHVAPASCSITFASTFGLRFGLNGLLNAEVVACTGTVTQTGNVTVSGSSIIPVLDNLVRLSIVVLACSVDGSTITVSSSVSAIGGGACEGIVFEANQTTGAGPSVTISGTVFAWSTIGLGFINYSATSISVGTYLISGNWQFNAPSAGGAGNIFTIGSSVSGGTWTVSGRWLIVITDSQRTTGTKLVDINASAGSFTVSGIVSCSGMQGASFQLLFMRGGASTINISSSEIRVKGFLLEAETGYGGIVIDNRGTGGSATLSGFVTFEDCFFAHAASGTVSMIGHASGGDANKATTGPSRIEFIDCNFVMPLQDFDGGAGTLTWADATLRFRDCILEDLLTLNGTYYDVVESYESHFSGNSADKSITMTGARPGITYRHWKSGFRARYDDFLPEVIEVYDVLPADAALVQGQPVTINATNEALVCTGTDIVEGVSLDAPAAAGDPVVMVKSGRVFVNVDTNVVNGDNLILDVATPTRCTTGAFVPSQNIGRALEDDGTTIAGKAYTFVTLR